MTSEGKFLLAMILLLVFCCILFFLTGLIHVHEDYVVAIGRKGRFYRILSPGWHYVFPFSKEVSVPYPCKPKAAHFSLAKKRKISLVYVVQDPALFFANHLSVQEVIRDLDKENGKRPFFEKEITQALATMGVSLSAIQITEQ
jgi:hypothetical protein